jgi:hypothetical protein
MTKSTPIPPMFLLDEDAAAELTMRENAFIEAHEALRNGITDVLVVWRSRYGLQPESWRNSAEGVAVMQHIANLAQWHDSLDLDFAANLITTADFAADEREEV